MEEAVLQINPQAAIAATRRINKLIFYIMLETPNNETWKEIPWADGFYWVSNKGRVLSLCGIEPKILKPYNCNGYLYVDLFGHGRRINRLVGQAFCDNPEAKPIVHHGDENKLNNDADNLAWATHSENTVAYYESKRKREAIESERAIE